LQISRADYSREFGILALLESGWPVKKSAGIYLPLPFLSVHAIVQKK
jgi:hypothetical protein